MAQKGIAMSHAVYDVAMNNRGCMAVITTMWGMIGYLVASFGVPWWVALSVWAGLWSIDLLVITPWAARRRRSRRREIEREIERMLWRKYP